MESTSLGTKWQVGELCSSQGLGGRKGWRARISREGASDAAGEAVEAAGLMERWEQWGGGPERGQCVKQEDRAHSSEDGQ